jgi:hypothetical protein
MEHFYHFIQEGERRFCKDKWGNATAKQRFFNILKEHYIEGNSEKSYFKPDVPESVSLSLVHNQDLVRLIERRSGYGFCFKDELFYEQEFRLGAVNYIAGKDFDPKSIKEEDRWLTDVISGRYNFSWEKEFRFKGSLRFYPENLLFIICPKSDKERISKIYQIRTITPESLVHVSQPVLIKYMNLIETEKKQNISLEIPQELQMFNSTGEIADDSRLQEYLLNGISLNEQGLHEITYE